VLRYVMTNAAGQESQAATIWVLLNDVNGRVSVRPHRLINGHTRMISPTINNHGDVIAYIPIVMRLFSCCRCLVRPTRARDKWDALAILVPLC
jgi:hypothetical protein